MPRGLRHAALALALACAGCASSDAGADAGGADAAAGQPDGASVAADAAVADAATAADAIAGDDAGCTPSWQQLLGNPGFESGRTIWNEDLGGSVTEIIRDGNGAALPFSPHAGSWAAIVLGYSNADVTLSQAVSVPADATMLRLSGQKCWVTTDTDGDVMTIEIRNGAGGLLETLDDVATTDAGTVCGWTAFTYDAAGVYAGQTIQLAFAATSDAADPTSFALDTLALEALVCQ